MNNTNHCFDGGICLNYMYEKNYREPCIDYECCSTAGADATMDLKMINFLQVFGLFYILLYWIFEINYLMPTKIVPDINLFTWCIIQKVHFSIFGIETHRFISIIE